MNIISDTMKALERLELGVVKSILVEVQKPYQNVLFEIEEDAQDKFENHGYNLMIVNRENPKKRHRVGCFVFILKDNIPYFYFHGNEHDEDRKWELANPDDFSLVSVVNHVVLVVWSQDVRYNFLNLRRPNSPDPLFPTEHRTFRIEDV